MRFAPGEHHALVLPLVDGLVSVVVGAIARETIGDLPTRTLQQDRGTELVGFRIGRRGGLVGESWVPKPRLSVTQFQLCVRTLAIDCDRHESELTGQDG